MYVHVCAAYGDNKRIVAEYVAASLDHALVGQIHDVASYGRAAHAQVSSNGVLGDHGILAYQFEDLLFTMGGHKQRLDQQTSVGKYHAKAK